MAGTYKKPTHTVGGEAGEGDRALQASATGPKAPRGLRRRVPRGQRRWRRGTSTHRHPHLVQVAALVRVRLERGRGGRGPRVPNAVRQRLRAQLQANSTIPVVAELSVAARVETHR